MQKYVLNSLMNQSHNFYQTLMIRKAKIIGPILNKILLASQLIIN